MVLESLSIISLMIAIMSVWLSHQHIWVPPFLLFLITGLISHWVEPLALVWMTLLGAVVWWHGRACSARSRAVSLTLLIIVSLLFATHLLPGFTTLEWWPQTRLSEYSGWSALRFTADKPVVALFLLLAYRSTLCANTDQLRQALSSTAVPMLAGISMVYLLGIATGYVVVDVSLSFLVIVWFVRNLLFTVIAEELFFRIVVQSRLESALSGKYAGYLALGITALLFGLVHLYAGWHYGLLATVAGLLYGYVYYRSRRVEMAILAHGLLNLGHLVLLSYPSVYALQPV